MLKDTKIKHTHTVQNKLKQNRTEQFKQDSRQGISNFANPRQRRQNLIRELYAHKLNPICDNCSNDVSRDRSNRGLTRGANLF